LTAGDAGSAITKASVFVACRLFTALTLGFWRVVTAVLQMIGRNFSGRELDRVQSRPTPMWKQLSWQPSLCVAGQIRRGIAHPFTIYGKF
jgi:hypothetical protein